MRVQDKVKAALALDPLSLDYQLTLSPRETLRFIRKTGSYNTFDPETALKLVKKINALIPREKWRNSDNPNNGKMHHNFKVGREYSRVIYLDIVKGYMPKNYDYEKLAEKLRQLAKEADAQEYTITEDTTLPFDKLGGITGGFVFRFWWD